MISVSRAIEHDADVARVRAELIDACFAEGFYPDYTSWTEQQTTEPDGRIRWDMTVQLSGNKVIRQRRP